MGKTRKEREVFENELINWEEESHLEKKALNEDKAYGGISEACAFL